MKFPLGKAITAFSTTDYAMLRFEGDRNALWLGYLCFFWLSVLTATLGSLLFLFVRWLLLVANILCWEEQLRTSYNYFDVYNSRLYYDKTVRLLKYFFTLFWFLKSPVRFFDEDSNSVSSYSFLFFATFSHFFILCQTGALVSKISDNPQKINGLLGTTLGTWV